MIKKPHENMLDFYESQELLMMVNRFNYLVHVFLKEDKKFTKNMADELKDMIVNKRDKFKDVENLYFLITGEHKNFMDNWDYLVSSLSTLYC